MLSTITLYNWWPSACSPSSCVGPLRLLWLPPTVQNHVYGDSKCVNVSMNSCCLSLG